MSSSSPSSSSMENKFKLKLSRMFKSSFGSCKTRISDVIEQQPVFTSQTQIQEPLSPPPLPLKQRPSFASLCKPRSSVFAHQMFDQNCIRRRNYNLDGQKCPPASPISPLNNYYYSRIQKYSKKQSKAKTHLRKQRKGHILSSNNGWFSSEEELEEEEEDETETLFSSKSFSSDSSESFRQKKKSSRRRPPRHRRRRVRSEVSDMGVSPFEVRNGKVKDSFAVVKRSSDPYNDFRTSMVEMIIEKQIFAARDLEQLLQCFLSLNSANHHRIIVEVFTEIWEALFSSWS
ncbi:Ovate protein family, C-terminal [Dillenia turbinata]|uniref:Transcription repressor n=1 Tax=Dillenia turbinata TaxID=194707 RepID=A0AAN8WBP8_9MAGN